MRKELQEAAEETRGVSPSGDNLPDNGSFSPSALPTNATIKFVRFSINRKQKHPNYYYLRMHMMEK